MVKSRDELMTAIAKLESRLTKTYQLLSRLDMPSESRSLLEEYISMMVESLTSLKNGEDINELPTPPSIPTTDKLEFKEFTLYPLTREIVCADGKRGILAKYDFGLLHELARNNGKPVVFGPSSSLLTHISLIRRSYPILKDLIITNRDRRGSYILKASPK